MYINVTTDESDELIKVEMKKEEAMTLFHGIKHLMSRLDTYNPSYRLQECKTLDSLEEMFTALGIDPRNGGT